MKAKAIVASWEHTPRRVAAFEKVKIAWAMHDQERFTFRETAAVLGYASACSCAKAVWRYRRLLAQAAQTAEPAARKTA